MVSRTVLCALAFSSGMAFFAAAPALADDSAASIAAGGLVARRETRIAMAKEVLRISPDKVIVDYDFRNDTDENVTTEVAFPVPPYTYGPDNPAISDASFSDFKLLIDGKTIAFQTEAKATLNGKDVTAILTADKIDIASFGHLKETDGASAAIQTPDVARLPQAEQQRLAKLGLFDAEDGWGLWTVHLQYHWTQTFPAHSTVHIQHQYTPVEGGELMLPDTLENVTEHKQPTGDADTVKYALQDMQRLESLCPDPSLLSGMIAQIKASAPGYGQYAHPHWVDFILTSANTWKQPIEDFTLIVERGKPEETNAPTFVSFCPPQNAPVQKLDANTFQVHLTDFVPKDELRIGYFDVPPAAPAPAPAKSH
jgi:uncharacterized protein DUF4424